jgi:L-iditol 2-dehydrogenase
MVVQLAELAGARHVVAVDPLAHRQALAASFGAVAVAPEQAVQTVAELTEGLGVDVAFEVAGTDPGVDLALELCRPGARTVLIGIPTGNTTTFTAATARRKGLTIVMSRRMGEVYPRAIAMTVSGQVDLSATISDRFALDDADQAISRAAQRLGHKVAISC